MIGKMANSDGYIPVAAVKYDNNDRGSACAYCVCIVPDGAFVESGDLVYFGESVNPPYKRGVCVSDTLFIAQDTLDMICRITNTDPAFIKMIHGKITVDWFTKRREDAVEQTVL